MIYQVSVCTGNSGRSPVLAAYVQDRFSAEGLTDRFGTRSAGTLVAEITAGLTVPSLLYVLSLGKKRPDIFTEEDYTMVWRYAEMKPDQIPVNKLDKVRHLANHASHVFHSEELSFRAEVPRKFGIKTPIKQSQDPIAPSLDDAVVLTVADRNTEATQKAYDQAKLAVPPTIATLGRYIGKTESPDVPNAFGNRDPKVYFGSIDAMLHMAHDAVPRIIEELEARSRTP